MKKAIEVIILALIIGIAFSYFIFKNYELKQVSKEFTKVYFVQQGVYSNYSNMVKNTSKLEEYTYEKKENKYYVYVCFTMNKSNIPIIEKYFKSLNYSTYIKEEKITDLRFINVLNEYDYLMTMIKNEETIKNICKQLVKKYDEYK